ncbi:hypothetical protein AB0K00_15300 [Dactylosporangium sp. NPDC049525]|uniref:hypothetical protein n=1 Tax=Dactylosporangium sp. NPDC049525 TaxID=3154730 RepID=UPI00344348AB
MPSRLWITINARLRPLDRGERYEDPLEEALDAKAPGSHIGGGGTLLSAEGEPTVSDVDLDVAGDAGAVLALTIATLEAAGVPKGSKVRLDDDEPITFGVTEGLAVYLNGTDLPGEVYERNDVNDLIAALLDALGTEGELQSYWEGPQETALYLYGPSAGRMSELIAGVLERFPLAQRCRVVPLPTTLPDRD